VTQYLENRGTRPLGETLEALITLGLRCQADVLQKAATASSSAQALSAADEAYHLCRPNSIEALEKHLKEHQSEYVDLI